MSKMPKGPFKKDITHLEEREGSAKKGRRSKSQKKVTSFVNGPKVWLDQNYNASKVFNFLQELSDTTN